MPIIKARLRTLPLAVAFLILSLSLGCWDVRVGDNFLFHPMAESYEPRFPSPSVNVAIKVEDGVVLRGVFLPHAQARGSVLFFGPNMNTVRGMCVDLAAFRDRCRVNILMVDYRGYGLSGGSPSLRHLEPDSLEVLAWLRARQEAARLPIVAEGYSLGSFCASMTAAKAPMAGVILLASGTTAKDYLRFMVPWYAKPFVRVQIEPGLAPLDHRNWVRQSVAPLLVVAGKRDQVAHWTMSRDLFAVSPSQEKQFLCLPDLGHDTVFNDPRVMTAVDAFLNQILGRKPA
jgi:pimeloyl-ACP methyl ester carboxylesterase